jgi:hypothetical protein
MRQLADLLDQLKGRLAARGHVAECGEQADVINED